MDVGDVVDQRWLPCWHHLGRGLLSDHQGRLGFVGRLVEVLAMGREHDKMMGLVLVQECNGDWRVQVMVKVLVLGQVCNGYWKVWVMVKVPAWV